MAKNKQVIIHGLLQDVIDYKALIERDAAAQTDRMPLPKNERKPKVVQKQKQRRNR